MTVLQEVCCCLFYLRDLPNDRTLREFAERYHDMDPSAVKACIALARVGSDLLTGFEAMLLRHGLSQGRFLTLMVMYRKPDETTSPSDLAGRVGVTRATMTGLLDGLDAEGLILRERQGEDRRRVSVRIAAKGRHLLERMLPDYYRRTSGVMTNLGEDERQQLVVLLEKVNRGISALTEP